jgi:hypothetical protein|tara:strand:+ start:892 stop:2016 length:1125 start_codon:yes stop_codon:yes gene_type:complete
MKDRTPHELYCEIISVFPSDNPGYGYDAKKRTEVEHPMTYALILMAEVNQHKLLESHDAGLISTCFNWLVRNYDLDEDGHAGWGLPFAWDAFQDGVGAAGETNPPNHPYTITTALVMHSLLDLLSLEILENSERDSCIDILRNAAIQWCENSFSTTKDGGHFWYSPFEGDSGNCPNVSIMMASAIERLRISYGESLEGVADLLKSRTRSVMSTIVGTAMHTKQGVFWLYQQDSEERTYTNDAVHHAYILLGMMKYLRSNDEFKIEWWNPEYILDSISAFIDQESVLEYPRIGRPDLLPSGNNTDLEMRMWGVGAMLAALAMLQNAGLISAESEKRNHVLTEILLDNVVYSIGKDVLDFRQLSHVVWGLSMNCID